MTEIFGRDKIIEIIWKRLQEKSIIFAAERRIGKTTVLSEIKDRYDDSCIVIYSDLEKISNPIELVENVLDTTYEYQTRRGKASKLYKDFKKHLPTIQQIGKFKFGTVKAEDWKSLLTKTIKSICENTDGLVVFLWDEIPYMLQKIHEKEIEKGITDKSSIEILDLLRSLMNDIDNLRFVYTGSIGLHHVIVEIAGKLVSEPTNNMDFIELKPLEEPDARKFTEWYLEKEIVNYSDKSIIEIISLECDCVPFYIEKIVKRLSLVEEEVTADIAKDMIEKIIIDANNELEMDHFRKRLSKYYIGTIEDLNSQEIEKSKIAKKLLDCIAISEEPQSIDDCYKYVQSFFSIEDRDLIIELLDFLSKDYYIEKNNKNQYNFCYTLIKRWWIMAQGLEKQGDQS